MSIFWDLINSKVDCWRLKNCEDFAELCILKSGLSKCKTCQFRKMFFIFSPPCTKNAKSNLLNWMKIKESWSSIILRLKDRVRGNWAIEMGEKHGMSFVRDKLYPLEKNCVAEKVAKNIPKNHVKSKKDLETRPTSQNKEKRSVNYFDRIHLSPTSTAHFSTGTSNSTLIALQAQAYVGGIYFENQGRGIGRKKNINYT